MSDTDDIDPSTLQPLSPYASRKIAELRQAMMKLTAAKCTLAKWIEWARMHGHLEHAEGLVDMTREIIAEDNR